MTNYIASHLQWIKDHKNFQPQYVSCDGNDYYTIMRTVYNNRFITKPYWTDDGHLEFEVVGDNTELLQAYAHKARVADEKWLRTCNKISKEIFKEVNELEPTPSGMWFVTIGFNHQTWNVKDCCKAIENILGMDWIIKAKANFELFRENGEHPHVHFILDTKEPKSRILDKLFRPQYVKKLVVSKSFIDIKPAMEHHHKYIYLDKQSDKQGCIDKDIEWRIKENIPDYEKNWLKTGVVVNISA